MSYQEVTTASYLPGRGRFQVGDRVKYVGEPRRMHRGQQPVQAGDMGTIVHDFGWDYRYLIKMDRMFWGGDSFHEGAGVWFTIRPGNVYYAWVRL